MTIRADGSRRPVLPHLWRSCGLSDVPGAGEVFLAHENDKEARDYAETFIAQNKEKKLEETRSKMSLDDLFNQIQEGKLKELNLIIKADVQGSVEAVRQSLLKLSNEEVVVKCIHGGVGAINESDVTLRGDIQCHHHRLQCASGRDCQGDRGAGRRGYPSVQSDLPGNRRYRGGHEGYAGSRI